jgi:hypothetical protein
MPEFRVGIFECPTCKSKFKSKVDSTSKPAITNVKDHSIKVKKIQEGVTRTLRAPGKNKNAGNGAGRRVGGNRRT